jgi:hypothetical protein
MAERVFVTRETIYHSTHARDPISRVVRAIREADQAYLWDLFCYTTHTAALSGFDEWALIDYLNYLYAGGDSVR